MATEMTRARKLVRAALDAGFCVSVHNGEEFAIKRSTDHAAICKELHATDEEYLIIRNRETGDKVGTIFLVWGNDPTGEELVCDHSAVPAIDAIVSAAGAL